MKKGPDALMNVSDHKYQTPTTKFCDVANSQLNTAITSMLM
jgi:hypothetical protein